MDKIIFISQKEILLYYVIQLYYMEILNIKVEKEMKERLERLVKKKAYKNKSEAVRKMLDEHFREHPELFASDQLFDILTKADEMSDIEFYRLAAGIFKGSRTSAELVAEGRDRFP